MEVTIRIFGGLVIGGAVGFAVDSSYGTIKHPNGTLFQIATVALFNIRPRVAGVQASLAIILGATCASDHHPWQQFKTQDRALFGVALGIFLGSVGAECGLPI